MKARFTFVFLILLFVPATKIFSQSFNPSDLTKLSLWLRADTGVTITSGAVSQWNDLSANNLHAKQTNQSFRPVPVSETLLNNHTAIKFNGTNSYLTSGVMADSIPGYGRLSNTVFIVVKGFTQSFPNGAAGIFGVGNTATGTVLLRAVASPNGWYSFQINNNNTFATTVNSAPAFGYPFQVFTLAKDSAMSAKMYINGLLENSTTNPSVTSPIIQNSNYILGTWDNALKGEIAEIIIYTRLLSTVEQQQVQDYIYNRYTHPVALGPDVIKPYLLCGDTIDAGNNFLSYLWSTGDTTSKIIVKKSGTYSVIATDVFKRLSYDTIQISLPAGNLNYHDTIICAGTSLNLSSALSSSPDYAFQWQDLSVNAGISAGNAGNYFVTITDTTGCHIQSDTLHLTVDNFASTVSLGPDVSLCAGNQIQLTNPSFGFNNYSFSWSNFTTDSVITVLTSGSYSVTVTNVNHCSGSDTITANVIGVAPTVTFMGDIFCLGETYNPQNTSNGNGSTITNYNWSFGNGDISNLANPNYDYTATGAYTVSLQVTTAIGCSASASHSVLIKENPTASFSATIACVNNAYQFNDSSLAPQGLTITQWDWDFGDNASANSQNPSHTYTAANSYSVNLMVTASNGCKNTASHTLQVVSTSAFASAPSLMFPPNGYSGVSSNINFTWGAAANALNYTLQISTDNFASTAQQFSNITASTFNVTLTGNQTYYWKVIAYNLCNNPAPSVINSFNIFGPADLSKLKLWLVGDSAITLTGGAISQWGDISGNNLHAQQSDPIKRPLPGSSPLLNNHALVKFDGSNDFLGGLDSIPDYGRTSNTVFVLLKGLPQTFQNGSVGVFGAGTTLTGTVLLRTVSAPNGWFNVLINNNNNLFATSINSAPSAGFPYKMLSLSKDVGVFEQIHLNGVLDASTTNPLYTAPIIQNNKYVIGGWDNYLRGEIAEIIVYTRLLSAAERQQVENYMYSKYAPPVSLGDDTFQTNSMCPITLDASNRFVSYVWSTGDTTATISANHNGYYWVKAVDVFGRLSRDTIKVSFPYISMSSNDTAVCLGQSLSIFPNVVNAGSFQYLWNDVNAATTQQFTPSITGDYFAAISDGVCMLNTDTVHVLFDSLALRSLLPGDTGMCSGNNLLADGGIFLPGNVIWSTSDTTAAITVLTAGYYNVDYTDVFGCNVKDTIDVTIKGIAPITDFTVSISCVGDQVVFVDSSKAFAPDQLLSWAWDFGDGNGGTGSTSISTYNTLGSYLVTHTVVTDSGCTGLKTKSIIISPKPSAEFTYPGVICAGGTSPFFDNSSLLISDTITQWKWVFNNTSVFTTPNTTYSFPTQGDVSVWLTVTTNNGCVDSTFQNVEVFAPLVADFSVNQICFGDSVAFVDLTPSFSVVGWQWNFGDGSFFATKQNPKHKYPAPGNYLVNLKIENAIGCIDTVNKSIQIIAEPIAAFTNQNTCEDQWYAPIDNSISLDESISWNWSIAGTHYNGQAPQHFFADTGNYLVRLKVTTLSGCVDSTQQIAHIYPTPTAQFDFTPLYGEAPVDISFHNLSIGATSYLWNFGDGSSSTDFEPTYTYSTNDTFDIQVQATSGFGCTDAVSKSLVVIKTDLDLVVDKVTAISTVQVDGSTLVTVKASIYNAGTRAITNFQVYGTLGSGGLISEEWNGLLPSSQRMDYVFTASFVVTAGNANTFVCVNAKSVNNGETELQIDNNSNCTSLTSTMQLMGPTPNPAFNQSTLGIILPKAGKVNIAITDVHGHYVISETELDLPEGRSSFDLPLNQIAAAEYFIRVRYNDDKQVVKFVVR